MELVLGVGLFGKDTCWSKLILGEGCGGSESFQGTGEIQVEPEEGMMGERPEGGEFRGLGGSEWSLQRCACHSVLGQATRAFSSISMAAPNCCQRAVLHNRFICTPPSVC